MAIDPQIIAYVTAAGNLAITAFLFGVVYGRLTSKISANSKDIAEVREAVESVNKKITTPEGDPLLMSYKAHDHICMRANEILSAELRRVSQAIVDNSEAVRKCGDQVSKLTVSVAVLEEKVEK